MKEKGCKRIIISWILFLAVFAGIFLSVQEVLRVKWGAETAGAHETLNANGFYSEPENSLDVMLYGSSYLFFAVSPMKMYEDYGFTSYARGSANQSIYLSYYSIKDSLRYQTPKVIVLEIGQIVNPFDPVKDEWIARRGLDWMELSPVKLEAIKNLKIDGSNQTRLSYVFPLLRYHSRWSELGDSDFEYFDWERHNYSKGQYIGVTKLDFKWPADYMKETDKAAEIPADNMEYFKKIVDLCREKGIELLLVKTTAGAWTYDKYRAIKNMAEDFGVTYLDFNLPEYISEIGITTDDFHYNVWHLRVTGAEKTSVYLGKYLKEHYSLPDRRSDTKYRSEWDDDLKRYNDYKEEKGVRYYSLDDPVLKSAETVDNGILITWYRVEHAKQYAVYRRPLEGKEWTNLGKVEDTEFLDREAEKGNSYVYTVKAINGIIVSFCDVNGLRIDY